MNTRGLILGKCPALGMLLVAGLATGAPAQEPEASRVVQLEMPDSSLVFLVRVAGNTADGGDAAYEYLPSRLSMERRVDGSPQLLFAGEADGPWGETVTTRTDLAHGVLYAVLDWKLNENEIELAERQIRYRCGEAKASMPGGLRRGLDVTPVPDSRLGSARVMALQGTSIQSEALPCGDPRGPATISTLDERGGVRLYLGRDYEDPDPRVSYGHSVLLPDQRLGISVELDSIASAWLAENESPPGAWWLELDLTHGSGYGLTFSYDIRPWWESMRRPSVRFALDHGVEQDDFGSIVDHVLVMFSKARDDGSAVRRSLVFDSAQPAEIQYGWAGDDMSRWMSYRYRAVWMFHGGGSHDTGWVEADDAAVSLTTPYMKRALHLEGDPATLSERGVREVVVEISYPFLGIDRRHRKVLPLDQVSQGAGVELVLPVGKYEYDYQITWHINGQDSLSTIGTETSEILFIDELPVDEEVE